jgi:hypothetical protein
MAESKETQFTSQGTSKVFVVKLRTLCKSGILTRNDTSRQKIISDLWFHSFDS